MEAALFAVIVAEMWNWADVLDVLSGCSALEEKRLDRSGSVV